MPSETTYSNLNKHDVHITSGINHARDGTPHPILIVNMPNIANSASVGVACAASVSNIAPAYVPVTVLGSAKEAVSFPSPAPHRHEKGQLSHPFR
eukprot:2652934-Rhodomonas_salina.3